MVVESPAQRWTQALSSLQSKIGAEQLEQWFKPLRCVTASASQIVLEAPNRFHRDWVRDHYGQLLDEALGAPVCVESPTFPATTPMAPMAQAPSVRPAAEAADAPLNPKYTFERFVVGPSNRFAHAASLAVADSPAKAYNPLFIYGGVGLGKTHLMQAIGHTLMARSAGVRVVYLSSEQFTNQLITAIQHRTTPRFREKYRHVDVLLIDDIHFIAGKESTQEEFFHTFNALHDAHKQIVLSSDRSPKDIDGLEARLVSRFEWGLVTDIQPPDLETRIAILRKKREDVGVAVPDEVTAFIGERVKSNIRELEGAMIRVAAFAQFTNRELSLALAQEVLRDMMAEEARRVTVGSIQQAVAMFFGLEVEELRGKKRSKTISQPRHLAMFLAREMTDHSLPEIGRLFGGRDHSTVLHAIHKVQQELATGAHQRIVVDKLRQLVRR